MYGRYLGQGSKRDRVWLVLIVGRLRGPCMIDGCVMKQRRTTYNRAVQSTPGMYVCLVDGVDFTSSA